MSDKAHQILDIYAYFDKRAGDVLVSNHFLGVGLRRGFTASQLDEGIADASRRGWISSAEEGGWRLTEDGFKEAAVA